MATNPLDYDFLTWLWSNLDRFFPGDTDIFLEEYTRDTGEPNPYDDDAIKVAGMEKTFKKELTNGKLPELISHICYEGAAYLPNRAVLEIIKAAVTTIYGREYAEDILNTNKTIRDAKRRKDTTWECKVCSSLCWAHKLEHEDSLLFGTTNPKQLKAFAKEWEELVAIHPQQNYDIICIGTGTYSYNSDVKVSTLEEGWFVTAEKLIQAGY